MNKALMTSMQRSLLETGYILMEDRFLSWLVEHISINTVGLHTQPIYLC